MPELETAEAQLIEDALEYWEWRDHVASECLTIRDILELEPGERLTVLPIHRNLCDSVYPHGLKGERPRPVLPATKFFRPKELAVYIHKSELTGRVEWGWDVEMECASDPFEFHVEYKPGHWYPLKDGSLPTADAVEGSTDLGDAAGKHWREFPPDTRVGWRGPMLALEKLAAQPPVFTRIKSGRLVQDALCCYLWEALRQFSFLRNRHRLERDGDRVAIIVDSLTSEEKALLEKRFEGVEIRKED